MRNLASLVVVLAIAACGGSKNDKAPAGAKPTEAAAVVAPTADEVALFLDGWLINVSGRQAYAKETLSPSATIAVEGCSGGARCLDEIAQLATVCMSSIEDGITIDGNRVKSHLHGEDFVIGSIDVELHKQGDNFVIDAVRATQKDGWTEPADEEAVAFVKKWLATMEKKAPAADAGLGAAVVHVNPDCDDAKPCIGARLHEIMEVRPAVDLKTIDRQELDRYNDGSGKLAKLDRVGYVAVEVSGNVQRAGMEYAQMTVAVAMDRHGELMIKGIEVESAYASDTGD